MNILIVNNLYYPNHLGGAEISTQLLAEELVKNGNKVTIISLTMDNEYKEVVNNVLVYHIQISNIYNPFNDHFAKRNIFFKVIWAIIDSFNIFLAYKYYKIIQIEKPDVIHTNNIQGLSPLIWLVGKKIFKIKIVHTLRDYFLLCPRSIMYKNTKNCDKQCLDCKIVSKPRKFFSKYIDTVVGISEFVLNKHLDNSYFQIQKKSVVANSVTLVETNSKNLMNSDFVVFGYIGTINKSKGVELAIEAFNKVNNNKKKLLIAGKGDDQYVQKIIKQYKHISEIKFLGHQEKSVFFNRIDVLVVPSLWNEPFGRVIIEAYSYGVPVIGVNHGGITELIINAKSGYISKATVKELSFYMQKIVSDENQYLEFSNFCIEYSKKFSLAKIANDYEFIYRNC